MKRYVNEIPNLKDMNFWQVKVMARNLCQKTNQDLSNETGIPESTIQQIFSRHDYNPSPGNVPRLCQALGNYLMIEWQAQQVGAHMIIIKTAGLSISDIETHVSQIYKEMADLTRAHAEALKDGKYSLNEMSKTQRELIHLIKEAEELNLVLDAQIKESKCRSNT